MLILNLNLGNKTSNNYLPVELIWITAEILLVPLLLFLLYNNPLTLTPDCSQIEIIKGCIKEYVKTDESRRHTNHVFHLHKGVHKIFCKNLKTAQGKQILKKGLKEKTI